jgi:hypothetical protein
MKNFTVIHILLFVLMMLIAQCSHAQDFVVTSKGDTLYGKVRPYHSSTDPKVQVTEEGKDKRTFRVIETQGYRFKNEDYSPVRFNNRYVFMKVLKPGYLTLFGFQMDNQVTYDGRYLGRKDGTGMEVPNLVFKKNVSKYLSDCPTVSKQVENGELAKKDLEAIVENYNNCMNKSITETVVANKKLSAWDVLETKVKEKDFTGKPDALEMITEIKSKIKRNEKVPSFMLEGLKNSLASTGLSTELQNALNEMSN